MVKEQDEWSRDLVLLFQSSDAPSYQAVYDGEGAISGASVDWVAIMTKNGNTVCRLGINGTSGLLACKEYTGETPAGEGKIEEVFEAFSDAGGIKLPSTSIRKVNGQKFAQLNLGQILVNPEVASGSFDKPK